jgi:hypothetical protein
LDNTWSGINTFNNSVLQSVGSTITGNITLPNPPLQFYTVSGGTYTVTFPTPSVSNKGCFVTFRRNTVSTSSTITLSGNIIPYTTFSGNSTTITTQYNTQVVSDGISWYQLFIQ